MNLKLNFDEARIEGLVLAKVGNPSRDEALQTSKQVMRVSDADQEVLVPIFVKPFRTLSGQRFEHHASLEKHEVNVAADGIFTDPESLLEHGCALAKRLYAKSNHPNIKSGDLCIALIDGVGVGEDMKRAICILKSESVTPFLSISARDGDLQLSTEHGINPEKIDKGCLIVDHHASKGFYVLTFDRAGHESRFWVRDFLSVVPISDAAMLSKRVAEMAVAAVTGSRPAKTEGEGTEGAEGAEEDDSPPWETNAAAAEALSYFDGKKQFSLQEFEEQALRTPEARAKFAEEKKRIEEEEGVTLTEGFDISAKDVNKAKKLMKSVMKLDTGVEIRLKPKVIDKPETVMEKGYDEERGMKYIKVFYHKDLMA